MNTLLHLTKQFTSLSKLLLIGVGLALFAFQETYAQPFLADLPSGNLGVRLKATEGGSLSPHILFDSQNSGNDATALFLQRQEGNELIFRGYTSTPGKRFDNQRMLMKMKANGNIGIFQNEPVERFHVNGNIRTDRDYIVRGRFGDTNRQAVFGTDGSGNHRMELRSGNNPYIDFANNAGETTEDYDARLILSNNDLLSLWGAGLRTDKDFVLRGRDGDTNRQGVFGTDDANNHRIELRTGNTPYIDFSNNEGSTLEDFDARLVLEGNDLLALRGAGLAVNINRLPQGYRFAVNGRALATGMKIQAFNNWPDYVFEPDYKLSPLNELEVFIKKNKHLPNVPSAAQVAKDKGFDVATINKVLLEKVEELTLYTIAQEKKIAAQQEQLTALIAKVDQLISKK